MESHCYYTEARYCTFFFVSFFSLSSFVPTLFTICQVVVSKLRWICLPYSDESLRVETFECRYLHPHKQCASLFPQLGWISPSTGDWKRSVTSVRSHSEFRTGCDSFLRQRDALAPQRFNRSHISVTGYRVLAGVWAPSPVWARRNRYASKPHTPCTLSQASGWGANCVLQSQCSLTSYKSTLLSTKTTGE